MPDRHQANDIDKKMRKTLTPIARTLAALGLAVAHFASTGQTAYPATLAGHAMLPAQSFIPAPKDAPADLQVSNELVRLEVEQFLQAR
jgi:hypothetical protein